MLSRADAAIIGGNGFIGSALARRLVRDGISVRVIGRRAPGAEMPGVVFQRGDVTDKAGIAASLSNCRTVYHLTTGGGETWADFDREVIEGCRNVAEACLTNGVQRFIYASSSAALYLGEKNAVTEKDGVDSRPSERSFYSRSKIEAEHLLREYQASRGLHTVIVRPAVVVGKGGMLNHSGVGQWLSSTCCIGWGKGTHPLPFVLVDDVADALRSALDAPGIDGMAFNLAGDVGLSAAEFVAELAARAKRRFRFYPRSILQLQMYDVFRWLVKIAARKPGNSFPSYRDLKSRSLAAPIDCSAAKQFLGWRPNADRERFIREAIDSHLPPIDPGDLRLVPLSCST